MEKKKREGRKRKEMRTRFGLISRHGATGSWELGGGIVFLGWRAFGPQRWRPGRDEIEVGEKEGGGGCILASSMCGVQWHRTASTTATTHTAVVGNTPFKQQLRCTAETPVRSRMQRMNQAIRSHRSRWVNGKTTRKKQVDCCCVESPWCGSQNTQMSGCYLSLQPKRQWEDYYGPLVRRGFVCVQEVMAMRTSS